MRIKTAILLLAAAQLISTQDLRAADIPARAPALKAPAAVVSTDWTGFYLNAGWGYGLWHADTQPLSITTGAPLLSAMRQGGKGWLGRAGGGYDYQIAPNIVIGVLADFDFSSLKGTIQDQGPLLAGEIKQEWSWAAGGRVGWLLHPTLMSYFNGGYTRAHFSGASMVGVSGAATPFVTRAFDSGGWFIGGGVETSIMSNWFWRTEYRYATFERNVLTDRNPVTGAVGGADIAFKPATQTITSQLVFKFNPGPAGAGASPFQTVAANWTGLYVNAGGGYGLWVADTTTTLAGAGLPANVVRVTERQGGRGWLGRIGGGYDHQVHPKIVLGVFGDFDFSSLKGTIQDPDIGVAGEIKQQWSWAAGARAGWLATPAHMGYVTGGYTSSRFSSARMLDSGFGFAPPGLVTPAFTRGGWFLGGGTEAALAWLGTGWFWRSEYRYAYYGSEALTDTVPGTATAFNTINFKPTVQTITTQLVFKLNSAR